MKKPDLNRLLMWKNVTQFLNQYEPIWSSNAQFTSAVSTLSGAIVNADNAILAQAVALPGAKDNREALADAAAEQIFRIAGGARAWARDSRDILLLAAIRIRPSDLRYLKLAERVPALKGLLDASKAHAADLLSYGVSADDLDRAYAALAAYAAALTAPRQAVSQRVAVTGSIAGIMAIGAEAVRKMDDLIRLFGAAHPAFVIGYRAVRKVIANGRRSNPPAANAQAA
jgi:hypothetical protein